MIGLLLKHMLLLKPPCSISSKSQLRIFWNYNTVHCSWVWFQRKVTLKKHLKMALDPKKICVTHYTLCNVLIQLKIWERNYNSLYCILEKIQDQLKIGCWNVRQIITTTNIWISWFFNYIMFVEIIEPLIWSFNEKVSNTCLKIFTKIMYFENIQH